MIRTTFKRIREFGRRKTAFKTLLTELDAIRKHSATIALYGSPTGHHWLGIANATRNLYPDNSLQLPQHYSASVLNIKELKKLCDRIKALNFNEVVLSGFAPFFFDIAQSLHRSSTVKALYHGTISELHTKANRDFITKLVDHSQNKIITEVACIAAGLAVIFEKIFGIKCVHQPLTAHIPKHEIKKLDLDKTKIHIGVLGSDTFNKNLHNQVIHALMIENTVIHVLDPSSFDYLKMPGRIIGHGTHLSRPDFLNVLASMDVNLYMSYNESFGLVAHESEALGVPFLMMEHVDYTKLISSKLPADAK